MKLILHAASPNSYGPAGGYTVYVAMTSGILFIFGFIVSATLGCTAGSIDLSEGMFRHLVVTGRSRVALYLARIPAGLAIIVPLVAIGFTIVCLVCVFSAPTSFQFGGVTVPQGLSVSGLESWAANNAQEVVCQFPLFDVPSGGLNPSSSVGNTITNEPCPGQGGPQGGPGLIKIHPGGPVPQVQVTHTQLVQAARAIAKADFSRYASRFRVPSNTLMIDTGLWIELEVIVGFVVGLGLGSLIGQRTISVIMMIVLQIVLTPILSTAKIPHLISLQRTVVGLATAHLTPGGLPVLAGGGGGGGNPGLLPESTFAAVCVITAWLVGWTIIGAWRMKSRDA
ncbi:MAG: hypothetical protein HKL80_09325 [Acidimicrobiales bacterium]|nr:hypothetical protein [Acidimicrobiales bacterium]